MARQQTGRRTDHPVCKLDQRAISAQRQCAHACTMHDLRLSGVNMPGRQHFPSYTFGLRAITSRCCGLVTRERSMKSRKLEFAIVSVLFAVLLSSSTEALNARDADLAPLAFAAAQTAKQQCITTCRVRYRDCRRLKQLPSFECRGVYQDCTRYSCTGLGPG